MPKRNRNWLTVLCEEKRARYIDGKEIPNWQQGPTLSETVNYLGAKGWMLWNGSALWVGHGKLTFIRPQQLLIQCEEKHPRYINGKEIPKARKPGEQNQKNNPHPFLFPNRVDEHPDLKGAHEPKVRRGNQVAEIRQIRNGNREHRGTDFKHDRAISPEIFSRC